MHKNSINTNIQKGEIKKERIWEERKYRHKQGGFSLRRVT
jgi:hypothetical protein